MRKTIEHSYYSTKAPRNRHWMLEMFATKSNNLPFDYTGVATIDTYQIDGSKGATVHYKNGNIHREDGPAIEYLYGNKCKVWVIDGRIHREDGPALQDKYAACDNYYLHGYCYSDCMELYNIEVNNLIIQRRNKKLKGIRRKKNVII